MPTKSSIQNSLPIKELFLRRNNSALISDLVAPTIYVDKVIGHYYRLNDANLIPENDIVAGRSGAAEITHDYEKKQFNVYKHALKEFIDYSVVDSSDFIGKEQLRKDALFMIKDKLLLNKELALSKLITNPANFPGHTSALTGTDRWDNAGSDPTNQFRLALQTIRNASGRKPNTLIIGARVNDALSYNQALADRVSLTDTRVATKGILAELLKGAGMDIPESRILVGEAQYKTGAGGATNYVWGDIALFCYIDTSSTTLFDDTLVKQFSLRGNKGVDIGFYRDNDVTINGEWAYGQIDYGFELVNYKCGYLFTTVVS
jgi:hypothetical protein